jgi:hypothetical protein
MQRSGHHRSRATRRLPGIEVSRRLSADGKLLADDKVLQSLEQKYGFETGTDVTGTGTGFPINVPTSSFLQELIHDVDAQL